MKGFNPPVTPAMIVRDNWRFSIPIYQRLFVWESEQIDRLLADLWAAYNHNQTSPYYIGVITTVEQNDGNNGRVFSVVDGQQRLTFLLLFFCDCLARGDGIDDAKQFVFINQSKPNRISFLGREDDEKDISRYIRYINKEWDKILNRHFRQFHTRMEIFIKKQQDWESKKGQFIEYVFANTSFLVNELAGYSNADLNIYFEKMNSTGRQLSPLDQLKGLFAEYDDASKWNDCFNFETTRAKAEEARLKKSDKIDGRQTSDEQQEMCVDTIVKWEKAVASEPSQRPSIAYSRLPMRPEVLALHTLRLTCGDDKSRNTIDLSPRHLLDTFKPLIGPDVSSADRNRFAKAFLSELKNYRDWIDENIIFLRGESEDNGDEDSGPDGLRYGFRDMRESQDNSQNLKMLQLQSMLYVSSGEKQEWILDVYEACKKECDEPKQLSFDLLRTKALERWRKEIPNIQLNELTYSPGMNRLVFWILDYFLWEKIDNGDRIQLSSCDGVPRELSKEQIDVVKRYRFTQSRSVEHLHPQHPQHPELEDNEWKEDHKNKDVIRNGFGNLCMISQSDNSRLSNDTVHVKFAKVNDSLSQRHPLQSIKLMLMFVCCDGVDAKWTPEQANKHGADMQKILDDELTVK